MKKFLKWKNRILIINHIYILNSEEIENNNNKENIIYNNEFNIIKNKSIIWLRI